MRDSEAVVTPFMQVATYATRNFAHTIPIFRSGMDFLFIQFAHMPYNHYVQMHKVHWIPNVKSLRIPKILVSLSNLLHNSVYKYQGFRIYPKNSGFLRIVQSLAFLLYTSIKSSHNAHYLCAAYAYIPKILVSLSNLLHNSVYKYQGSRIYPKIFSFLRIIQSPAYYCMQVSRFPHICLYCAIIFTVYKYQEL